MASRRKYIKIPEDFSQIKDNFIFGLTKRQFCCFGIGAACGLPVFFIAKNGFGVDITGAVILFFIFAAPGVLCGIYQKNGIYLEKQVSLMFQFFIRPRKRIYRARNEFERSALEHQARRLKKLLQQNGGGNLPWQQRK